MKKVGGGEGYHTVKITASVVKTETLGTRQMSSLETSSAEHRPEVGEENDRGQRRKRIDFSTGRTEPTSRILQGHHGTSLAIF